METSVIDLNTSPISNSNSSIKNAKNIILIDNTIENSDLFFNSNNEKTLSIKYNYYTDRQKLSDHLKTNRLSNVERLCFIFDNSMMNHKHFLNNEPFFNENDISNFDNNNTTLNDYSDNVKILINIINSLNIKHVDFLACNSLQYINWTKYYQLITNFTSAIVGASNDLTGNIKYGGNWLMENTNEDIQNIYFNDNITNYSLTLINNNIKYVVNQYYGNNFFRTTIENVSSDKIVTLNKFTNLSFANGSFTPPNATKNFVVCYRKRNELNFTFVNNNNLNIIIYPKEICEILILFQSSHHILFSVTGTTNILITDNILSMYSGLACYITNPYIYNTISANDANLLLNYANSSIGGNLSYGLDYSYDFTTPRPTITELITAKYTYIQIKAMGYSVPEFKTIGYTIAQLKELGFTELEIKIGGFTSAQFKTAGYKIPQLKALEFNESEIRISGFTIAQFIEERYTDVQIKTFGFTVAEFKTAGYTIPQLKTLGFTESEIRIGGFTIAQFKTAGYTDVQIKTFGFTIAQFKAAGYTITQLKAISFTDQEIKTGGYTTTEFKIAGYIITHLQSIGFTDSEIQLSYIITEVNETLTFDNSKAITLFTNDDENIKSIDLTGKNYKYYNLSNSSYDIYTQIYVASNGWLSFYNVNEFDYGGNNQQPVKTLRFYGFDAKTTAKYYFDNNNNCIISYVGGYYANISQLAFDITVKITPNGIIYVNYNNIGPANGNTFLKPIIGWVGDKSSLTTDDVFYSTFDGIQPFNQNNINGKKLAFNLSDSITIGNICFAFGTPITTDQGDILIQDINTDYHTINNKKIICVTKTLSMDTHLVCFEKNSLGNNIPNNKTITSKFHGIYINDELIRANDLVNNESIHKIEYNEEILYNILMEDHEKVSVNNMICETLHPTNYVAQLYRVMDKLDHSERERLIKEVNRLVVKNKTFALKLQIVQK